MRADDRNYILSSWTRSYAGRAREAREYATLDAFYEDYGPIVSALLDRSRVLVAALKEDPDIIVGWLAIEDETLHYALVKPRWRKLGVARWMLSELAEVPLSYSHVTSDALRCPIPAAWAFRRFRIWPRRAA